MVTFITGSYNGMRQKRQYGLLDEQVGSHVNSWTSVINDRADITLNLTALSYLMRRMCVYLRMPFRVAVTFPG